MKIQELQNKKIAILGYGMEWKSTEKFLKKLWIKNYTILDKNTLPPERGELEGGHIFWENYLNNLKEFDIIFKSPWISPYNNPELLEVKEKLTSQAEILADNFEWKIIWITGTKGKSTTSTLLYEILKELWYKTKLVWNIWNPVLDEIDIINWDEYDFIVYELSSYMLEWLDLNIEIGLLNNIYDCHLDWHNWRKNYENAKFNVFKNAKYKLAWKEIQYILEPHTNTLLKESGQKVFDDIIYFWNDIEKFWIKKEDIFLEWEHNYKNISGILNILKIILNNENSPIISFLKGDENIKIIKDVLAKFRGLPHRQENIWTYKWITFINDAIASTPESAIAAIKTFGEKIGTIFIWNEDSWFDLTELNKTILKYKIKNIVLFPTTWEKLFGEFSKNMEFDKATFYNLSQPSFNNKGSSIKLYKTLSMEKAVKFAYENTPKWKIVLLSTWAPSFNADGPWVMPWKWFIEKWEMFKNAVKKYA